jgi:hypothetical protein
MTTTKDFVQENADDRFGPVAVRCLTGRLQPISTVDDSGRPVEMMVMARMQRRCGTTVAPTTNILRRMKLHQVR